MPLPKPNGSEKIDDFLSRCMGNDVMNSEYPDQKQRAAVCYSIYRQNRKKDFESEKYDDLIPVVCPTCKVMTRVEPKDDGSYDCLECGINFRTKQKRGPYGRPGLVGGSSNTPNISYNVESVSYEELNKARDDWSRWSEKYAGEMVEDSNSDEVKNDLSSRVELIGAARNAAESASNIINNDVDVFRSIKSKDGVEGIVYYVKSRDGKTFFLCDLATAPWNSRFVFSPLRKKGVGTALLYGTIKDILSKGGESVVGFPTRDAESYYKKLGANIDEANITVKKQELEKFISVYEEGHKSFDYTYGDLIKWEELYGCLVGNQDINNNKGGQGSGFFGHHGRPGLVGGGQIEESNIEHREGDAYNPIVIHLRPVEKEKYERTSKKILEKKGINVEISDMYDKASDEKEYFFKNSIAEAAKRIPDGDVTGIKKVVVDASVYDYEKRLKQLGFSKDQIDYEIGISPSGSFFTNINELHLVPHNMFNIKKEMKTTFIHEVAHNVWKNFLSKNTQKEVNELYKHCRNTGSGFITQYAETNSHEFFAESYRAFYGDKREVTALANHNSDMFYIIGKLPPVGERKSANVSKKYFYSDPPLKPIDPVAQGLKPLVKRKEKGGQGSGFFDHSGRPGLIGGSSHYEEPDIRSYYKKLPDNEKDALHFWMDKDYNQIQETEMHPENFTDDEKKLASDFNSALDKFPLYKDIVYRGIAFNKSFSDADYDKFINAKQLSFDSSYSASMDLDVALTFTGFGEGGKNIIMQIMTYTGADLRGLSTENEIVLRKGNKYNVIDKHNTMLPDGNPVVEMTLEEVR